MHYFVQAYEELVSAIFAAMKGLNTEEVESLMSALLETRESGSKVLVVGAGRSGLVGKAFAMRLMHLGFRVYVLGETINPYMGEGDLVIVISGSGKTTVPLAAATMAKRLGARVVAITSQERSPLALNADLVVDIPGRDEIADMDEYHSRQMLGMHESLAPMGTLFEDTVMVFLDSLIAELMNRLGLSEDSMRRHHATIE
ncbi:6-phospho-3-hexuloisomerase [Candidatus Bathyarchaeota archaeon]|nr:6-phospho-3-hexuloisomerase [Candidatus Bathyarchaeota archaeon]